ncbi:hypothetical protein LINPERHAP2_LOCUS27483 [Linum perenne]
MHVRLRFSLLLPVEETWNRGLEA